MLSLAFWWILKADSLLFLPHSAQHIQGLIWRHMVWILRPTAKRKCFTWFLYSWHFGFFFFLFSYLLIHRNNRHRARRMMSISWKEGYTRRSSLSYLGGRSWEKRDSMWRFNLALGLNSIIFLAVRIFIFIICFSILLIRIFHFRLHRMFRWTSWLWRTEQHLFFFRSEMMEEIQDLDWRPECCRLR